jgi:hypothetical protein
MSASVAFQSKRRPRVLRQRQGKTRSFDFPPRRDLEEEDYVLVQRVLVILFCILYARSTDEIPTKARYAASHAGSLPVEGKLFRRHLTEVARHVKAEIENFAAVAPHQSFLTEAKFIGWG